jgi:hypothetical protein
MPDIEGIVLRANPPHSYGEVSASYADGGVMGFLATEASDPSVADRAFHAKREMLTRHLPI